MTSIDKNVLGGVLKCCCLSPITGYYRDGFCRTSSKDYGGHTVCAIVTEDFLQFSKSRGNDLITPKPEYSFPGLRPGDKWCLCATRWLEAEKHGKAPPVDLEATNIVALNVVPLEILIRYAFNNYQEFNPQEESVNTHKNKISCQPFGRTKMNDSKLTLLSLPDEILLQIIKFLDHRSIGNLLRCNMLLNNICEDESLWKYLSYRDLHSYNKFTDPLWFRESIKKTSLQLGWKGTYKYHTQKHNSLMKAKYSFDNFKENCKRENDLANKEQFFATGHFSGKESHFQRIYSASDPYKKQIVVKRRPRY